MSTPRRVAAVDVGTNSVRLLVAERDQNGLRQLQREMVITRLGQGVDAHRRLDDQALRRTLEALASFGRSWRTAGAERVRITATSAVRDAEDRDRFFDGAEDETGIRPEVLSGEDEAATAFRGATATLDAPSPFLVLDIGGGSTEFIRGSTRPDAMTSRQIGCVRLTERCLHADPPQADQIEAARALVRGELAAVDALFDPRAARTLVGVAGTVTTIGALHLGLEVYEPDRIHGVRVSRGEVARLSAELASMTTAERAALGPMASGREDVIVGGAVILEEVMRRFGFPEVLVSEADILDGLALGLLDEA